MKDRTCENIIDDETCGGPPYSWSVEHGNTVLCVACYRKFLKNKNVIAFKQMFDALSQKERDEMVAMMGGKK